MQEICHSTIKKAQLPFKLRYRLSYFIVLGGPCLPDRMPWDVWSPRHCSTCPGHQVQVREIITEDLTWTGHLPAVYHSIC